MGNTGQYTQHHAKTVVERYRNTQAILIRKAHRFAGEETIVQYIEVGQGRTLWQTGRTTGELDIDRIIGLVQTRE